MTLLPLTSEELRSIGYQSQSQVSGARYQSSGGGQGTVTSGPVTNGNNSSGGTSDTDHNIVRPDYSQMVPFKPKVNINRDII